MFDREIILGRDSSSAFPTESKQAANEATEALKVKLGANRFITETEVNSVRFTGSACHASLHILVLQFHAKS